MIPAQDLLIFAAASLLMVLTPGPNMIYLISRSICQGPKAGVVSLLGVVGGFFVHLFAAALGLTAVFMAVPLAYELLKWAGALYLLWLARCSTFRCFRSSSPRSTARCSPRA